MGRRTRMEGVAVDSLDFLDGGILAVAGQPESDENIVRGYFLLKRWLPLLDLHLDGCLRGDLAEDPA